MLKNHTVHFTVGHKCTGQWTSFIPVLYHRLKSSYHQFIIFIIFSYSGENKSGDFNVRVVLC